MKPAPFAYHAPATLSEAVSVLAQLGDQGRVLAGGQSLLPLMNFRLAQPAHLVDIRRLDELDYIRSNDGWLAIGARVRQAALERSEDVRARWPLLVETIALVGHPPIRHQGTVCGSVAHADPAAELPAALLALGAEVVLATEQGEQRLPIGEFVLGPYATACPTGGLLKEVRVPAQDASTGYAFVESSRRHGDFAIAGAAALLRVEQGRIDRAAIALCGVAGTPVRASRAEGVLHGTRGAADFEAAAQAAVDELEPPADVHGSAEFRRNVARVCVQRALERALAQAQGGAA
jgi:CO/xanthine dehydrogenase FAD-binding subunit